MNKAFFHFEANSQIGAGHAMRSSVLADLLIQQGWHCEVVTTKVTYEFMKSLERFQRHEPSHFYHTPLSADLSVFDNYSHDIKYENHYKPYSKKVLVIEDHPNRQHNCDILVDQTYGRLKTDYINCVPQNCHVLSGDEYALLRPEFAQLRPKALEKRKQTHQVQRILISMGGADLTNQTQKALALIAETDFLGAIDIVLGFQAPHEHMIQKYIQTLPNNCTIHRNANMVQLCYEADLAIGAAGSSVWERLCLGLPQFLFQLADNQSFIFKQCSAPNFHNLYQDLNRGYADYCAALHPSIDGLGAKRVLDFFNF